MKLGKILVVVLAIILAASVFALAQSEPNLEVGFKPYGSYHGSDIESVSLMNGNLALHVPYPYSFPQRGSHLDNKFFVVMNSKTWMPKPVYSSDGTVSATYWTLGNAGLADFMFGGLSGETLLPQFTRTVTSVTVNNKTVVNVSDMAVRTWDGATHLIGAGFEAADASGWNVALTNPDANGTPQAGVIIARDGTQYSIARFLNRCSAGPIVSPPSGFLPLMNGSITRCSEVALLSSVTDTNGNVYSLPLYNSDTGLTTGTDSMGRGLSFLALPPGGWSTTSDSSGCSTSLPFAWANVINYLGPNGTTSQLKMCFGSPALQTNFGTAGIADCPNSQCAANAGGFATAMLLGDGSRWTFNYDSYGYVSFIGLPLGGSINYQWATIPFPAIHLSAPPVSRAVVQRTITDNRGNSYVWKYQWLVAQSNPASTNGTFSNVVTDPLNNDSVHVFTNLGGAFFETRTQFYQGLYTTGQLVKQIDTTYQVLWGAPDSPSALPTNTQTTIYPSGKVSSVQKTYDSAITIPPGSGCPSCGSTTSYGKVLIEKEYDWGQGAPGALLRETDTTYEWQVNSNYLTAHLLDLPASVITKDGSGNRVAETDYTYDEPAYLAAASISTQHSAPPGQVRGNLTTVSHWLNTSNSWITSHSTWYDTGEVYQQIDPLGHTTTHSYDPAYVGAFSTQTCNVLNHCVSGTYDFTTGLLTSFTNANATSQASGTTPGDSAHTTNYAYDSMSRLTSATSPPDPAGGGAQAQTQFTYPNPITFPFTVTKTKSITSSLTDSVTSTFDGLGRVYKTQHPLPNGTAEVDTSYDGLDRLTSVTNPYFSTTDPTYGVIQSQYDALGRATTTIKQDGSFSTVDYSAGNCTTSTDEAGKQRRACSDGLGRLTEVDEPGGDSAGAKSSGSFSISGTLQSIAPGVPQPGRGSVTFNGSEQSKAGAPATSATGGATISGSERSVTTGGGTYCAMWDNNGDCVDWEMNPPTTTYDSGTVTITVNGHSNSTSYDSTSTQSSVATGLANAINGDSGAFVNASALNGVLNLTARQTGIAGNSYSWSISSSSADPADFGSAGAFSGNSGTMSRGANAGNTVYDSGACTVTVNGTPYSTNFGQGDTTSAIISRLVTVIGGGTLVSASASAATISFTAKQGGTASNYSLGSNCSYNSSAFTSPSFSAGVSGATLTGGSNGSAGATDSGTVTINIAGVSATANYGNGTGQDSTAQAVASDLASKLTAQNPPFSISTSGTALTMNWNAIGAAGNVVATCSSATSQPASFSAPSFTCPGTTLSGGADATPASLATPYVTLYQYDALGNLLRIDQKGSALNDSSQWRTRLFTYNSLSQLLTAYNPESGTITYSYDSDGNLLQKTSPQANQPPGSTLTQTISYCYDSLHRVTGKAYSAQSCPLSTPVVSYAYDSGANAVGKLISLTDPAGSGSYSYDLMGRISTEQRTIAGVSKTVSYDYNLDGSLKVLHYPSGAAVTYTPDAAGRMLSALDSANSINYVTGATYGPDSALTGFVSGNTITNSFSYNNRLQPVSMSAASPSQTVFSIGYDFHLGNGTSGSDNGNVWGITNYKDTSRNQSFTYDALNRLTSAQNAGTDCSVPVLQGKSKFWGNGYTYDAWGNLTSKGNLPGATSPKCNPESLDRTADTQNRLHVKPGAGADYQYDAAGNMTYNASGMYYSYDQENRITGAGGYTYVYDSDGNRVEKTTGGSSPTGTLYWYMSPGIVAESDLIGNLQSEYVFFDGERVARRDGPTGAGGVFYYFSDHLKTTDVVTDAQGNILNESDFYPWGGELQFVHNDSNHYLYGGHERDNETGLDYQGARYYSNPLGRFLTPDWAGKPITVPYANFGNPQSLNLYTYGKNNPTTFGDPDGHDALALSFDDYKAAGPLGIHIPFTGHGALVTIDSKGHTRGFEYGRYDAAQKGIVRNLKTANVVMKNGKPTEASMKKLLGGIAKQEHDYKGTISGAYYKMSDKNTQKVDNYATGREAQNSDADRTPYNLGITGTANNCGTFARDGVHAGGADTSKADGDSRPESIVGDMQKGADTRITYDAGKDKLTQKDKKPQ